MKDSMSLSNALQQSMFDSVTKKISNYVDFMGTQGLSMDAETGKFCFSLTCMTGYCRVSDIFKDPRVPKEAFLAWLESNGWQLKNNDLSSLIATEGPTFSFKNVVNEEEDIK